MLGRLIDGRYQVRSRIARGGMATVYLATDLRLERRVAIKIMHGHLADDSTFKNRFVQEARSAARLAHPNVVNVFDQGQDSDMAYLVMEYLPGITLRELLQDYGKLTAEQTVDILDAVLSGLAAAHRAGIVHRDLKPENVLLADDGRIKIGDFGLARAASKNTGTGQALLGTIAYLSPELVTRGIADTRSDIYALGIMMYEMLTGEQPFQGEQPMQIAYQHANDTVPLPSARNPEIPPQLDELVHWATQREPDKRPRDAGELLERLREIERRDPDASTSATMLLPPAAAVREGDTQVLSGAALATSPTLTATALVRPEASASEPVAELARLGRRRRRHGWWLFALVIILAAAAGGTGWYFGAGPGAMVTVPVVVAKPAAAADAALHKLGFTVKHADVYSAAAAAGIVVASDPVAGTRAHNGSAVTLQISKGRQPITLPALAGQFESTVKQKIAAAGATVGSTDAQFDSNLKKGIVISAAKGDGSGGDLSQGGAYFKGLPVNLLISLGPVPDVSGMSVSDATSALGAVGLKAAAGSQSFSDDVPSGDVISASPQNSGPVRPGDTILLNTSRGPQLFPVPNVVGDTLGQAKSALSSAGFTPVYSAFWDAIPDALTKVATMSPDAGSQQPKGAKITLGITAAG